MQNFEFLLTLDPKGNYHHQNILSIIKGECKSRIWIIIISNWNDYYFKLFWLIELNKW